MKCPHAIEPHQIQGGDFIHIFPVVQWLVTRLLERRAEIGDFNRAYAISQYEKELHHSFPEETHENTVKAWKENIEGIRVMNDLEIDRREYFELIDSSSTKTSISMFESFEEIVDKSFG